MDEEEKNRIIARYSHRLDQFGLDPRTLGWTKGKENLRFEILLSHWSFSGETILDFGCGFGDMGLFIQEHGLRVRYVGLDINPRLIAEGKRRSPQLELAVWDPAAQVLPETYDYIFSCGVHNLRLNDNHKFVEDTFCLFRKFSRKGFAANFLSTTAELRSDENSYSDPSELLRLALGFSKRVTLRHDYMPFEFSVFVDHAEHFEAATTVFDTFEGKLSR